jgi:transglutaminase-like putative cysteine protease
MGIDLRPGPAVTVPVRTRSAQIDLADGEGPWLPSQTWPARVDGVAPLVEERHGTLLLPGSRGPASYTLTWWQPEVDAAALGAAAIDPDLPGGLGSVGSPPPGVTELASRAVRGVRPSFQAALALERYLRDNYRVAVGDDLPTGHAWPQLADFLLRDKRGTSEQFAAAYVALARMLSIPARLVVGFRAPAGPDGYTVRNGDVLAWPEIAVAGIGWVPLDPSGTATASSAPSGGGLAAVTARARAQLPAPEDLRDPPVTAPRPATPRGGGVAVPWTAVLSVAAGLAGLSLAGWLVGVPAAKTARAWRRRRRPGAGAVVGAWEEARDRLREHGVPVSGAMTVRDLATAAAPLIDRSTVEGLRRLSSAVDRALWSSSTMDGTDRVEAWAAVRAVQRGLARRGWLARLRARLHPRTLGRPG